MPGTEGHTGTSGYEHAGGGEGVMGARVPLYYELNVCAVFPFKGIVLYFANEQYIGVGNESQELIRK